MGLAVKDVYSHQATGPIHEILHRNRPLTTAKTSATIESRFQ